MVEVFPAFRLFILEHARAVFFSKVEVRAIPVFGPGFNSEHTMKGNTKLLAIWLNVPMVSQRYGDTVILSYCGAVMHRYGHPYGRSSSPTDPRALWACGLLDKASPRSSRTRRKPDW